MDRRERINSPHDMMLAGLEGWQSGVWTSLPGIVQSFDAEALTCSVQPSIQMSIRKPDGTSEWVSLPLLIHVPVIFPCGGGLSLTFPIKPGDEVFVSFASRCIDSWWQQGGVQVQTEFRMHDLSDGFAFPGPRSLPRGLANVSAETAQLRSDDGSIVIDLHPTSGVLSIACTTLNIAADVNITGGLHNNGKDVGSSHTHGGVAFGGSSTDVPN